MIVKYYVIGVGVFFVLLFICDLIKSNWKK